MNTTFRTFTLVALVALAAAAVGCGGTVNIGETGAALTPAVPIATGLTQPGSLVTDDTYVYFVDHGDADTAGSIRRVAKTGGAVTVVAEGERITDPLLADATQLYWTSNDYSADHAGAVRTVAKSGGRVSTLAAGLSSARGLTADTYNLYFATDEYIVALSKRGGMPIPLAPARCVNNAASDSTTIYWSENCVMFPPQGVFAVSKLGGMPVKLSNDAPWMVFADGSNVYWVDNGLVKQQSRFGGLARVLYDTHAYGTIDAQDATSLFLQVDQQLIRVSKLSGAASVAWSGDFTPNAATTDATSLYFDGGYPDGAVYRLPR